MISDVERQLPSKSIGRYGSARDTRARFAKPPRSAKGSVRPLRAIRSKFVWPVQTEVQFIDIRISGDGSTLRVANWSPSERILVAMNLTADRLANSTVRVVSLIANLLSCYTVRVVSLVANLLSCYTITEMSLVANLLGCYTITEMSLVTNLLGCYTIVVVPLITDLLITNLC